MRVSFDATRYNAAREEPQGVVEPIEIGWVWRCIGVRFEVANALVSAPIRKVNGNTGI
jgi:hypothetical protein